MGHFSSYESAAPERMQGGNILGPNPDGSPRRLDLLIVKVAETNDRINSINDPTEKDNLPEWKDPTDQLVVTFMAVDKSGVISHRFNAFGFVRFNDIPEEKRKGYIPLGEEGYAVKEATMTRVHSKERCDQCDSIFNQFMDACGLPVGSGISQLANCTVSGEIKNRTYNEETRSIVGSFRKVNTGEVPDLTKTVQHEVEEHAEESVTDF